MPRGVTIGDAAMAEAVLALDRVRVQARAVNQPRMFERSSWHGDVLDMRIEMRQDSIDVTAFGASCPTYMALPAEWRIWMQTIYDPAIGMPPIGEPVIFDQAIRDGSRISGEMVVTEFMMASAIGSLVTLEISGVSTGAWGRRSMIPETTEPPVVTAGQRAIVIEGAGG